MAFPKVIFSFRVDCPLPDLPMWYWSPDGDKNDGVDNVYASQFELDKVKSRKWLKSAAGEACLTSIAYNPVSLTG